MLRLLAKVFYKGQFMCLPTLPKEPCSGIQEEIRNLDLSLRGGEVQRRTMRARQEIRQVRRGQHETVRCHAHWLLLQKGALEHVRPVIIQIGVLLS
jgi:hypothetical protein